MNRQNKLESYVSEQTITGDVIAVCIETFCSKVDIPTVIVMDQASIHVGQAVSEQRQQFSGGLGSLVLGTSGAISVFKAVYIDKLELNCACVGGNSKAPLGVVSFLENTIMMGMGVALLWSTTVADTAESLHRSAVANT